MKKHYLIALILGLLTQAFNAQKQIISINDATFPESSYGPEQLIEDVLISSTCTTVNSFSFRVSGNPTDTNTKSYGYFKRNEEKNFPFEEGVILTNGHAFPAGNTVRSALNVINNINNLPGDADLESALSINGTEDATFIKFNFVPLINTISFRFLMASEEYDGDLECHFADGFAFLLREVGTTNYTNLAVLPDNTPVSVRTINNSSLINNVPGRINCDANINFFEGYNLIGTNYGGRTKVLTAAASVTPNTVYEIKLVVADQGDAQYDSAIFLEAGSFNIGGNLGPDRTVTSGNPGCDGTFVVLDATLALPGVTYKWFKEGIEILGETNATISVGVKGTYSVEIDAAGGCNSSDEIVLEFTTPPIVSNPPEDVVVCETDNDFTEVFDFTNNGTLVLGAQSATDFPITYHATQVDAEQNQNPLPLPYTNTARNETIWLRIADMTQTCFEVGSFNIEAQAVAIANVPLPYELCDNADDFDDTNGTGVTFNLSTKINEVLGTQSIADYEVKFYNSQTEADAAVTLTEIISSTNTSNPQRIFARIENRLNTACYATTFFDLIVNLLPVTQTAVSLTQCDDDTDRFSNFNLTEANVLISANAANETFAYYLTAAEAEVGAVANQITNFAAYTNLLPGVGSFVYARIENPKLCYRTSRIDLIVGATQIPSTFHETFNECDDTLTLPGKGSTNTDGIASFDFTDADNLIRSSFPQTTVSYYTNLADALAETNAIPDFSNHRNDASPFTQNIYVRIDSDVVNACLGLGEHITLTVDPVPLANTILEYVACSDTNFANFDLTTKDAEVIGTQTRAILVSYHGSLNNAENNLMPLTSLANAPAQTIYVRAQFDDNGNGIGDPGECVSTDMSFDLVVNPNPIVFTPDTIKKCDNQVETVYDLTIRKAQITGGDASMTLSYFETQTDLNNNIAIINPELYNNRFPNNTILVLATGTNMCTSVVNLELETTVYDAINLNPMLIEECEIDNNGFDFFDLRRREIDILNGLDASNFSPFLYYENEGDAIAGHTNYIQDPANFENTQKDRQTIYVRVEPIANGCFQIATIELVVNPVPEIQIENEYVICLAPDGSVIPSTGNELRPSVPVDTQLSVSEYSFQWYRGKAPSPLVLISGETNSTYSPTIAGDYTVIATDLISGCTIPASTLVIGSYPPESITAEVTTDAFSKNDIIEVTVVGNGDYEFRLDDGSWQDSPIFEHVKGGEHTIFIRDIYNCDELASQNIIIIDYPRFFTPNGDGYNDLWQIYGISDQFDAKIFIYDRYGKLLKQLRPANPGWDGTFNGGQLTTNDYWFTVEYTEPNTAGVKKVFKSHFTLKR